MIIIHNTSTVSTYNHALSTLTWYYCNLKALLSACDVAGGSAIRSHACNVSNSVSHDTGDVEATKPRLHLARVNLCFKTVADITAWLCVGTKSDRNSFQNKLTWVPFKATNDSSCAITSSWEWQTSDCVFLSKLSALISKVLLTQQTRCCQH